MRKKTRFEIHIRLETKQASGKSRKPRAYLSFPRINNFEVFNDARLDFPYSNFTLIAI